MDLTFDINTDCIKCNHDYITQCTSNVELIDCTELAWDFILRLRNENSSNFIDQHEITKEEHYAFMEKYGKNYFIFYRTCNGCKCGACYCPSGFIGIVNNDIRLCTDSSYRREGVAVEMLEFVRDHFPNAYGRVKVNNIASQKVFEKVNYWSFKTDEYFFYYVPEDLREDEQVLRFLNKHLMRCFYCSKIVPSSDNEEGLSVCKNCITIHEEF